MEYTGVGTASLEISRLCPACMILGEPETDGTGESI